MYSTDPQIKHSSCTLTMQIRQDVAEIWNPRISVSRADQAACTVRSVKDLLSSWFDLWHNNFFCPDCQLADFIGIYILSFQHRMHCLSFNDRLMFK